MTDTREPIRLTDAQETLLIPLYCKAQAEKRIFVDPHTRAILEQVDYDFARLKVPHKTCVLIWMRASQIDRYARDFLRAHPDGLILHLGCGLDARFLRLDNGAVTWYDLDMPDVIALRRTFFEENSRYRMIPSSVTELNWIDGIEAAGRPTLIIAEGLLMYLTESDVRALVLRLREAFPGCQLVCDAFSAMTAKRATAHPSLKRTGASLGWGIDDPHDLERWADGIRLIEEWYFTQSPDIAHLSAGYRFIYRLVAHIPMVQRAHRLLYYTL
jgi:O-methyltransferase involved in polyketide biosynthesis